MYTRFSSMPPSKSTYELYPNHLIFHHISRRWSNYLLAKSTRSELVIYQKSNFQMSFISMLRHIELWFLSQSFPLTHSLILRRDIQGKQIFEIFTRNRIAMRIRRNSLIIFSQTSLRNINPRWGVITDYWVWLCLRII